MDYEEKKEQSSATEYFETDTWGEKALNQMPVQNTPFKKKSKGSFGQGMFLGVVLTILVVTLILLGVKLNEVLNTEQKDDYRLDVTEGSAIDYDMFQKLQSLEKIVRKYYYKDDLTSQQLCDGIYKGLLDALGDPYSEYYTPEELQDLIESTEGVYYGIGAYVSMDTDFNRPKISSVIEGTPAEEAGLRDNDILYEVDGTSTYGLSLNETVALIKGEEFTDVLLTIIRDGKEMEVSVTRRKVETPTVKHEMLEGGMGFLQIVEFDDITVSQFSEAMTDLRAQGMKGLILDLRANPGGSLDAVVDIAEMLLPEGMIVYTEDKYGNRREYTCDGSQQLEMPLVVLIDMNSASASEILAGAIKDYGIGTLVGTTSFGKGIVQQILPFSDGSAIKVTVSSYYTPKGYNIHGIGIEPDVTIEFDGETYYSNDERYDNQLEKAKEVLQDKMK